MPRTCRSRASPPRSARRSIAIRAAHIERHYRASPPPSPSRDAPICYSVKANPNLAVIAHPGAARRRRRRGLGRRVPPRARRRRAGRAASSSPASARPRPSWNSRSPTASARSTSNPLPELELLSAVGAAHGPRPRRSPSASIPTSMRAPTPRSPPARRRTSSASISPTPPRRYAAPRRCPGIAPVGLAVHIGSQLTDLAPFELAFARVVELVARAARPRASRSSASISAAGSASATATRRRPRSRTMRRWSSALTGELGVAPRLRAGPRHRRQCRRAGRPGALRQGGRDPPLRHPRRGDERSASARRSTRPGTRSCRCAEPAPGAARAARRRGRPGLRDRRQLRRRRGRCRRSPPGDLVALLSAGAYGAAMSSGYNTRPAGARGAGAGRRVRGHPATAELRGRSWRRTGCRPGSPSVDARVPTRCQHAEPRPHAPAAPATPACAGGSASPGSPLLWERLWPALWPAAGGGRRRSWRWRCSTCRRSCPGSLHVALLVAVRWRRSSWPGALPAFAALPPARPRRGAAPHRDRERPRPPAAGRARGPARRRRQRPGAAALWQAHRARMAAAARRLRVGAPAAGLAAPRSLCAARRAWRSSCCSRAIDAGGDWADRILRA